MTVKIIKCHDLKSIMSAKTVCAAASCYLQGGLMPVPMASGKKNPVLKKWHEFSCTENDIDKSFNNQNNIGLILGRSGLLDVDFDCSEAIAFADLLPVTASIRRPSKSISHLLYRVTEDVETQAFRDADGQMLIELRAGNHCVLAPPSTHPSGEQLTWAGQDIAKVDIELICEVVRRIAAYALIARNWPNKGGRHQAALAVAGVLARSGVREKEAIWAMQLIAALAKDNECGDRIRAVKDTYKKWCNKENVSGFKQLGESFGIKVEKKISAWLEINNPQKLAAEDSLSKYVMSGSELLNMSTPPIEYIVMNWLPAASLSMVYAQRGTGKSFFAMDLALSIATGQPHLDQWKVPKPRRVLIVDGEMPTNLLKSRLERLSTLKSSDLEQIRFLPCDKLHSTGSTVNIADQSSQKRIDEMLAEMDADGRRPDLIILDNLSALAWGLDENSNSEQDEIIKWLLSLRGRGYAVMLLHHTTKDGKTQRGAGRREDALDTVIHLKKVEGPNTAFEVIFTKLRSEKAPSDSLVVTLIGTPEGKFEFTTATTKKRYAPWRTLKVLHHHKFKSLTDLSKHLGISRPAVTKHVNKLVEDGYATKKPPRLTLKGKDKCNDLFGNAGDAHELI